MNVIDAYRFGQIIVNGKHYVSDVIIYPDRVNDSWWRKTSHQLHLDELSEVITEKPEVLVIGTGVSGLMKVLSEVREGFEAQGIELVCQHTREACQAYNQLCRDQRVIAALHLTC